MTNRTPIQYAAGTLAASAFIAVTQLLSAPKLDFPLHVALTMFALNIPFQIIIFFMPFPMSLEEVEQRLAASQGLSWPERLYLSVQRYSTAAIIFGFAAMFWHFALWLGVLFALAAWSAYRIFRYCAFEDFKQESAEHSEQTPPKV